MVEQAEGRTINKGYIWRYNQNKVEFESRKLPEISSIRHKMKIHVVGSVSLSSFTCAVSSLCTNILIVSKELGISM